MALNQQILPVNQAPHGLARTARPEDLHIALVSRAETDSQRRLKDSCKQAMESFYPENLKKELERRIKRLRKRKARG